MAFTIESLIPLIHHEKQERGSMLCAQHALNALLRECRILDDPNSLLSWLLLAWSSEEPIVRVLKAYDWPRTHMISDGSPQFSVTDLAQIAKSLDDLEDTYNEDRGQDSVNMDDSGNYNHEIYQGGRLLLRM